MVLKYSLRVLFLFFCLFPSSLKQDFLLATYVEFSIPKLGFQNRVFLKKADYKDTQENSYLNVANLKEKDESLIFSLFLNTRVISLESLYQLQVFDHLILKLKETTYFFQLLAIYGEENENDFMMETLEDGSLVFEIFDTYTNSLQMILVARNTGKLVKNN